MAGPVARKVLTKLTPTQIASNDAAIVAADILARNAGTTSFAYDQTVIISNKAVMKTAQTSVQQAKDVYTSYLSTNNVFDPVYNPKGTVLASTLSTSIQNQLKADLAAITSNQAALASANSNLIQAQTASDKDKAALAAAQAKLVKDSLAAAAGTLIASTKKTPPPTNSGPNKPAGTPKAVNKDPGPYFYNAPMTSSSYMKFGSSVLGSVPGDPVLLAGNPQVLSAGTPNLIVDPGSHNDATKFWKPDSKGNFSGAKGTIQMNLALSSDVSTNAKGTKAAYNITDTNNYGFKFLYNPTTVDMTWGTVDGFSPQFEQTGGDIATAIGNGLLASTVSFSLILNRIQDMQFIKDSSGAYLASDSQPYPHPVAAKERGMIYDRGTMYDLEYLFRTTGGYNSQYQSGLNGKTADKGWLMPIPVELHLGAGLRYLVRLSTLEVNHIIFNERMVPLFTTVNVTCTRYFDNVTLYSQIGTAK